MPYDVVAANQRATQVGTQLGQAMFNNSLRMQQLQSEQALQRLQQQQAAETLSWTMRQHQEAIDQEAQNAKNTATFMARIAPTISVPLNDTDVNDPNSVQQVPNPVYTPNLGAAYIESFLKGSKDPAKVLATGGALMYHQAQAKEQEALAAKNLALAQAGPKPLSGIGKMQSDRAAALQRGDDAAVKEIDDAIAKQKATGPASTGAMERNVRFLDAQLANGQITKEQYDHAKEIALNLAPKVSAASEWMSRIEVSGLLKRREMLLEKQIMEEEKLTAMEAKGVGGFTGVSKAAFEEQKRKAASWKARVQDVDREINSYKPRDKSPGGAVEPPEPGGGDNVLIKTPKGEVIPIPRVNLPEALKHGAIEYGPGKPGYEG